jgi:hypothetical protein
MKITSEHMMNVLREAGLQKAGEGVVFPWGVKIAALDGKNVLQPMTPDEYRRAVEKETGRTLSDEEVLEPKCVVAGAGCISQGCKQVGGTCSIHHDINGFYCLCDY